MDVSRDDRKTISEVTGHPQHPDDLLGPPAILRRPPTGHDGVANGSARRRRQDSELQLEGFLAYLYGNLVNAILRNIVDLASLQKSPDSLSAAPSVSSGPGDQSCTRLGNAKTTFSYSFCSA